MLLQSFTYSGFAPFNPTVVATPAPLCATFRETEQQKARLSGHPTMRLVSFAQQAFELSRSFPIARCIFDTNTMI
jgi:hypothetical protein